MTSPVIFASLHATSLCLPLFVSLHLTSRNFTLPPMLFASLHLTSCLFASPPLPFPHLTSRHFTSPPFCLPHFTPHTTSLYFCITSRHFTLLRLQFFLPHLMPLHTSPPILSGSPHAAFFYFCLTSPNFMPLHHFSGFVHLTSRHFTLPPTLPPVLFASLHLTSCHITLPTILPCFASPPFSLPHFSHFTSPPVCPPHFTPLHATSPPVLSYSLHATSRHFTPPPVIFASLHTNSLHLPSFCLTSPHLISSVRPSY